MKNTRLLVISDWKSGTYCPWADFGLAKYTVMSPLTACDHWLRKFTESKVLLICVCWIEGFIFELKSRFLKEVSTVRRLQKEGKYHKTKMNRVEQEQTRKKIVKRSWWKVIQLERDALERKKKRTEHDEENCTEYKHTTTNSWWSLLDNVFKMHWTIRQELCITENDTELNRKNTSQIHYFCSCGS